MLIPPSSSSSKSTITTIAIPIIGIVDSVSILAQGDVFGKSVSVTSQRRIAPATVYRDGG